MTATAPRRRASLADTVTVFHALSDETRLAVLEMLRGGERCVCDLQDAVGAAQSRLSFHLKVLKDAGLVTDRKEGRWSYYALNTDRLADATATLGTLGTPAPRSGAGLALHALARAPQTSALPARTSRIRSTAARRGDGCC